MADRSKAIEEILKNFWKKIDFADFGRRREKSKNEWVACLDLSKDFEEKIWEEIVGIYSFKD